MVENMRVFPKMLAFGTAGLLFFFALAELLLLTFSGGQPPHYTQWAAWFVYFSGFIAGPLLMFAGSKIPGFRLPAIVWFHLTLGVLLLWFSEIFSPFTPMWSLAILFASMYFGWRGFVASSAQLVVIAIAYCVMFANELQPNFFVYAILSTMIIFLTILMSYVFVRIIIDSRKKNHELEVSRQSEFMQVNRLNTLLNSLADAVMTLNRYGRITSQNAAAQAFFDTNTSLIGRDIGTILKPKDQNGSEVNMHEVVNSVKSVLIRDDLSTDEAGDIRHLSVQLSRIKSTFDDDEEYGVVIIIRDITKQKSLEEEKDEFISVTSHELRTPVAIAEGSLSNILVMYDKSADPEVLKKATKTAYDQTLYLANIINDLSTLSRAERGVGDGVEEIDVTDMINNLYKRYEAEATAKSLRLDVDVEAQLPHVTTSRLYLEEIMQNFITNSIKYTKEGSVTVGAKMLPGGGIKCFVTDTGIGMSKSDLEHIFEKFYRSEDYRTRETSGTGLGLYVVRKLADKLGTTVDVESRLNHGSTFSFVLPLKSPQAAVKPDETKQVTDAEPAPVVQ